MLAELGCRLTRGAMDEASQAHPPTISASGKYLNTNPWNFYGGDVYDDSAYGAHELIMFPPPDLDRVAVPPDVDKF